MCNQSRSGGLLHGFRCSVFATWSCFLISPKPVGVRDERPRQLAAEFGKTMNSRENLDLTVILAHGCQSS